MFFERKVAEVSAASLLEASFFQKLMPDEDKSRPEPMHFTLFATVYSLLERVL